MSTENPFANIQFFKSPLGNDSALYVVLGILLSGSLALLLISEVVQHTRRNNLPENQFALFPSRTS